MNEYRVGVQELKRKCC